jgi:hypothetical protein
MPKASVVEAHGAVDTCHTVIHMAHK